MKNILTILILTICSFSFAQTNLSVTTNYRKMPNGETAKESFTFIFNTNSGTLLMTDNDFGSTKEYLIKFKETMYDKLLNICQFISLLTDGKAIEIYKIINATKI